MIKVVIKNKIHEDKKIVVGGKKFNKKIVEITYKINKKLWKRNILLCFVSAYLI